MNQIKFRTQRNDKYKVALYFTLAIDFASSIIITQHSLYVIGGVPKIRLHDLFGVSKIEEKIVKYQFYGFRFFSNTL